MGENFIHGFFLVLYWPSRHAPSAIFPVVHERNRCFNWFIVLRFPLTHVLLCECVCISHCYSATIATQLYWTAVSFLNIHQLRLAVPTCCWTKTVQEGDQLLVRRVPGPGTDLRDQISSVGFLQQPSFEDESSLLMLPSLLLFNTGDQTKLLATRSCIHGVFCVSRSAENWWSYLSPKTSGFQCCLRAKEPPAALFLKDATANQPKRTVQVGKWWVSISRWLTFNGLSSESLVRPATGDY